MEELKSLFGENSLSFDEFNQKLNEAKDTIYLANLKSNRYVERDKYEKAEKNLNDWKTKFSALEESTKGFNELQTQYDALKADYDALKEKQDTAEKMSIITGANVNPKFAKFVASEVQALTNESKDFKTALEEYLKDNKEFLNTARGSYANLENGVTPPQSPNEKMNNFIRGRRNGI